MTQDEPREIKPPQKRPVSTATRNMVEAAVEAVPFAGVATALSRAAFPPAEEKDRDRWAGEVTSRVNEIDKALRSEVIITGTTAALAEWLVRASPDGLYEPHVTMEQAAEALGDEHLVQAVDEAAEELEGYRLVRLSRYMGGATIRPEWRLFAALDPQVKNWDVEADARTLAVLVVVEKSFSAAELERRSGFERRRFNPALSKLLTMFDPNMVSKEIQPHYPTSYAHVTGGTRARLRRFIQQD